VVLSTITSDIHDQIAQRIHLPAAPQPVKAVTSTVLPGLQFKQHKPVAWMQVLGGDSDRDAEDNARAYEHDYVGINGGYEWDLGQRRVGLVGGVVNSDTDGNENSFKSDTEHFYLGAYTSQQLQGFTLTTSLLGGYGRHDNERLVIDNLNGREVAKSDFSSLFISPSVTIASAYKIYERVELRPSASVNYSIAWLDDHSERGTTQSNLSVDDRKIQALSTKLQIAAAYAYSATSEFELRTGVNSRYTDDDDTEISIGGSKSKFSNVGDENVYSSFVGARVRIIGSDQLSLVADVELGGNGDEDYKAGHLSVEYTFH
jgi:outer membrane autotransporter protein